ncbi:hypothetical protein RI367_005610 [Sorochytrium milnesiophthora]
MMKAVPTLANIAGLINSLKDAETSDKMLAASVVDQFVQALGGELQTYCGDACSQEQKRVLTALPQHCQSSPDFSGVQANQHGRNLVCAADSSTHTLCTVQLLSGLSAAIQGNPSYLGYALSTVLHAPLPDLPSADSKSMSTRPDQLMQLLHQPAWCSPCSHFYAEQLLLEKLQAVNETAGTSDGPDMNVWGMAANTTSQQLNQVCGATWLTLNASDFQLDSVHAPVVNEDNMTAPASNTSSGGTNPATAASSNTACAFGTSTALVVTLMASILAML